MTPQQVAEILWTAGKRGIHFPDEVKGQLDRPEGYRTQMDLLNRHISAGEKQAGWKIGFTAPAVRALFNSDSPVFGYLLESRKISSGQTFPLEGMINPLLESELCFKLAKPLKGPGVTAEQAKEAVGSVYPAFEIVDARVDMAEEKGLALAGNVSQWAYVLGDEVRPMPQELKLGDIRAEILRNGEVILDAYGRDVIDEQYASLAWLANETAKYDTGLEAGQIVLSGSFNKPHPLASGENWETRYSGLGNVTVRFR